MWRTELADVSDVASIAVDSRVVKKEVEESATCANEWVAMVFLVLSRGFSDNGDFIWTIRPARKQIVALPASSDDLWD